MDKVVLRAAGNMNVTSVSNSFIDFYMPAANGSYVKVYLYLLRCFQGRISECSISYLADRLDHTEKDIIRALRYWEKAGLLNLAVTENGAVASILLNEPRLPQGMELAASGEDSKDAMYEADGILSNIPVAETSSVDRSVSAAGVLGAGEPDDNGIDALEEGYMPDGQLTNVLAAKSARLEGAGAVPSGTPVKKEYTPVQIAKLSENEEVQWIMNIIEQYLERPLKPKDVQLILYLYDTVGFSSELIMYLYEYCISRHKRNASYIEAVAIAWAEQGIATVDEAEASNVLYNSNYAAVEKAFGLNRMLGAVERDYIDKWVVKYRFSVEIITEACNRTILNTQKADFKYADRILENWYKQGVKTTDDIKRQDALFNKNRGSDASGQTADMGSIHTKKAHNPNENVLKRPANNRFNAFPQRNYTKEDYEDIEKRLLHR